MCCSTNEFCPFSALQSRVEGSGARNKQIWKSNQQSPSTPLELICIWSRDHVLFISNHNQSEKKLINEGARQKRYPPSGGCTGSSTPWKAHTRACPTNRCTQVCTCTHEQGVENSDRMWEKKIHARTDTHSIAFTHTRKSPFHWLVIGPYLGDWYFSLPLPMSSKQVHMAWIKGVAGCMLLLYCQPLLLIRKQDHRQY